MKPKHVAKQLKTPKEVMEAFLAGKRLVNTARGEHDSTVWFYLSEEGIICEEDGTKAHHPHLTINMSYYHEWFELPEDE
jgi:hypothetical protein